MATKSTDPWREEDLADHPQMLFRVERRELVGEVYSTSDPAAPSPVVMGFMLAAEAMDTRTTGRDARFAFTYKGVTYTATAETAED